jgi:hypothetical protein
MKLGAIAQSIWKQSATQLEMLGELYVDPYGRAFRYAKAGEALVAGKVAQMAEPTGNHVKQTGDAIAKGAKQVSLVLGATEAAADLYKDGFLQIYDGAAGTVGLQYHIQSSSAAASAGTIILTLDEPIRVAVISTDTWSLVTNPFNGVTHNASLAHGFAGIPLFAVTSGYYCWLQVAGPGIGLNGGNTALGSIIVPSATEGAYKTMAAYDSGVIGFQYAFAGVDTKYCPIWLTAGL